MINRVSSVLTPQSVRQIGGLDVFPVSAAAIQGTCLLLVARGGGGKTTAASTVGDSKHLPTDQKILYLDVEGNIQSIRHREDCEFVPIAGWDKFERIGDAVNAGELKGYYHTIVLDNVSELIDIKIRDVFGDENLEMEEQVSWPQWNRVTRDILARLRDLRNVSRRDGINVIVTAWDMPMPKREYLMTIKANPALRDSIPGIIPFIGYLEPDDKTQERIIHFETSTKHIGKWQCAPTDAAATVPLTFPINVKTGPHLGTVIDVVRGDEKWPTSFK